MKRGSSGLSLVVGVNKPVGMSSHDVVNKCRGVFGEKRVGHTGTLDPLAEGVMPVCVGPATRLDKYLVDHDKTYIAEIEFGYSTTTDDSEGEVVDVGEVDELMFDERYARSMVIAEIGSREQMPPAYSAIKVDGRKSYEAARKGQVLELETRPVIVHDAELLAVERRESGVCAWSVLYQVSKGTYIRSLARDLGQRLGCPAHLSALKRIRSGRLGIEECVSLETLEKLKANASLDPVRLLGFRFAFADELETRVSNGNKIGLDELVLYDPIDPRDELTLCACTTSIERSLSLPHEGELICVIVSNRLKAIYAYDAQAKLYKPDCVFSIGVSRV